MGPPNGSLHRQTKSPRPFIQRINRLGLASACVEGMLSTSAPFLAVMDADLQHDEQILPQMLHAIKATNWMS